MTLSLTHSTVVVVSDDPAFPVGSGEWNAEHSLSMATGRLLGRTTAGTGEVEEISVSGLTLSGGSLSVTGLSITSGKTLTVSNTLTLAGTDGSTLNIGNGGTLGTAAFKNTGTSGNVVPLLDGANTFSAAQTITPAANTVGLTISGASITGSNTTNFLRIEGTWNTSAYADGIKLIVTDTASPADNSLIALGTVSAPYRFYVDKAGNLHTEGSLTSDTGNVNVGASAFFNWAGRSNFVSPADGDLEMQDNAGGTFRRLQWGGTGTSHPALGRDGAGLALTVADGSTGTFLSGLEQTAPSAPGANGYRLYAQDNGAGKTQLMVIFNSGAAQQIAIQP